MDKVPYDRPLETPDALAYRRVLEAVYRNLVAAGVVRPGERQTVDAPFLEQVFTVSGRHKATEAAAVLRELRDDLDPDGRAEITLAFVEHLEDVVMAIAVHEVTAEMADSLPADATPFSRGFHLSLAGRNREALAAYTEAIASGEAGLYPYWDRGRVLQCMGRLRQALADFDRYLASPCPYRRPTAWSWRAQVLTELGRTAEAVASMARAVADLTASPWPCLAVPAPGAPPADAPSEAPACPSPTEDLDSPPTPQDAEMEEENDYEEEDQEEEQEENDQTEDDPRGAWLNELQVVIKTVRQLDESSRLTPDLRPALEAVKAAIVRLRREVGV